MPYLSSNDWNGDDPSMWNPAARDSSPIIFTFMSSRERPKQDAAAAREEGNKTEPVEESRCGMGAGAVGLAVEQPLR